MARKSQAEPLDKSPSISVLVPLANARIRSNIWQTSVAFCWPTGMRVSRKFAMVAWCLKRCWAHARRKFVELDELHKSPVAAQMIAQVAAFYGIEQEIRGRSPNERRRVRQERTCGRQAHRRRSTRSSAPLHRWRRDEARSSRWAGLPSDREAIHEAGPRVP
jgi:hypothetical protein